jgi:hypothetical protein
MALELGATRADDVCVSELFTVLRDPAGNEFCVLRDASTSAPWASPPEQEAQRPMSSEASAGLME